MLANCTTGSEQSTATVSNAPPQFPSNEVICAPIYGFSEIGSVPYCSPRYAQCGTAENGAKTRLTQAWLSVPKSVRNRCLSDVQDQRKSLLRQYPKAEEFAWQQGYRAGYSVSAVEACIASKLNQPPPPKIEPMPAKCVPGSVALPTEESKSASEQCAFPNSFAHPDILNACIASEAAAKSGIAMIRPSLSERIVSLCAALKKAPGFDGENRPYRSSAFLKCAQKAIQYRGLKE
jgi:hypothetical protein